MNNAISKPNPARDEQRVEDAERPQLHANDENQRRNDVEQRQANREGQVGSWPVLNIEQA